MRELAEQMLKLAAEYPEYRGNAAKVKLRRHHRRRVLRQGLPGRGQSRAEDRQHRAELDWEPRVTMREALQQIFEAYRGQLPQASHLLD